MIMSLTYISVVVRISNDKASFRAKDNSPKSIAQYIQDINLHNELFEHNGEDDGFRLISVGIDNESDRNYTCVMIGASVPMQFSIDYHDVITMLDKKLLCDGEKMFWTNDANYIIIQDTHQSKWWEDVIKEMSKSYTIETHS